jgi:hypothetical protein
VGEGLKERGVVTVHDVVTDFILAVDAVVGQGFSAGAAGPGNGAVAACGFRAWSYPTDVRDSCDALLRDNRLKLSKTSSQHTRPEDEAIGWSASLGTDPIRFCPVLLVAGFPWSRFIRRRCRSHLESRKGFLLGSGFACRPMRSATNWGSELF